MHDLGGLQNPKNGHGRIQMNGHWSDEFQKIRIFFFGKSCSRGFGAPGCRPGTLIDLVNVALDRSDEFRKIRTMSKSCSRSGPCKRRIVETP